MLDAQGMQYEKIQILEEMVNDELLANAIQVCIEMDQFLRFHFSFECVAFLYFIVVAWRFSLKTVLIS